MIKVLLNLKYDNDHSVTITEYNLYIEVKIITLIHTVRFMDKTSSRKHDYLASLEFAKDLLEKMIFGKVFFKNKYINQHRNISIAKKLFKKVDYYVDKETKRVL